MKNKNSISERRHLAILEYEKTSERLSELHIKLIEFIETIVGKKTIRLKDGNQPIVYDQEGAFSIETIYKDGRCYGVNDNGHGVEFDFGDLSADDLNAIAEAVIMEIK